VGVILADLSLNIVDFRAGERTFSLLTQVAGRSGRGKRRGRVIIQTYNPEHYTIQTSLRQDYISFYNQEIERRKILGFPPFSQLIKLELRHKNQKKAEQKTYKIKELLEEFSGEEFEILGPAPHPVPKLRGEYRWNLIIKSKNLASTLRLLYNIIGFRVRFEGVKLIVDVNPYED
jgi:primosomal protein N' (replication factor Y)